MAQAALGAAGLHFDELNKLRVLQPEVAQQTAQLREECKAFVDRIAEFQKTVGGLIELVDQLAKAAESEKMKAIGARNLLKSIAKQREAQEQQLQALIAEKKMQLERYRIEYEVVIYLRLQWRAPHKQESVPTSSKTQFIYLLMTGPSPVSPLSE
nr:intraflagellar transport protein 20 homolog [Anas platyrhynchos]